MVPRVASQLEVIPDYVIVLGPAREVLYLSAEARTLPYGSFVKLLDRVAAGDTAQAGFGRANLDPPAGGIRYFVRPISGAGPRVRWVISGAATAGLVLGPQRLLLGMLEIAPFILAASTLIGYLLVGRTLKPVESIVDEVEANRRAPREQK